MFFSVEALNRHFPEVVLSAEVCEFIVADGAVIVAVVAEHSLCDIFELIGVLFEEFDECSFDFFLIELSVFIRIINFQKLFNRFSNLICKRMIIKNKRNDRFFNYCWLWRSFKRIR